MQNSLSGVNANLSNDEYIAATDAITRADSAINQFLNMSAARLQNNNNNATTINTNEGKQQGNQVGEGLTEGTKEGYDISQVNQPPTNKGGGGGAVVEGLVEGTKTNFGLIWKSNNRVHGLHQAKDMMQVKELILDLKQSSNQLIVELGKFPNNSPVIETSRTELEETCKHLIQSLGIIEKTETPQVGEAAGQNTAWLIDFWKIKYKEVADKYNKLIIAVKQKLMHGQISAAPASQHQQNQLQNQHSLAHLVQQTPKTNLSQTAGGQQDDFGQQRVSSSGTHASNLNSYVPVQPPEQINPSPSVVNPLSIGPTPPQTPRTAQPHSKDIPPDSAILFVEGLPQQQQQQQQQHHLSSRVNVIRCDRVRPVPVKDRGVKVGKQEEYPIPPINNKAEMTEEEKKLLTLQAGSKSQQDTAQPTQGTQYLGEDYMIKNISIDSINIEGVVNNQQKNQQNPVSQQPSSQHQYKSDQKGGGKSNEKESGGGGGQTEEGGNRRSRRRQRYNKGSKNNNNPNGNTVASGNAGSAGSRQNNNNV